MKFSILTPTRERALNGKFERFLTSVLETVSEYSQVECLFYIDDDDPDLEEYKSYVLPSNVVMIYGPAKSVSNSWNDLAACATGDVLLMGNDDQVYKTKNWDLLLKQEIADNTESDNIYCMWVNDDYKKESSCCFPIVSRDWYETLGYFAPGIFKFFYNDTWIFEIAKKLDRLYYVDSITVEHKHFTKNPRESDNTTRRNRVSGNQDTKLFEDTEDQRIEAANKLQDVIDAISHSLL